MSEIKISKDLQDTVRAFGHIGEVYFTKTGEHFFHVHSYQEVDDKGKVKGKEKKYGRMTLEAVHVANEGDRKIYKNKSVPVASTEIVKAMSRDEVLEAKVGEEKKDDAAEKLKAENEELKKKLAEATKAKQ